MNSQEMNINNLTQLWELGAKRNGFLFKNENYSIAKIPYSDWPNKLWLKMPANSKLLAVILQENSSEKFTISLWEEDPKLHHKLIDMNYTQSNELIGMSLNLDGFVKKQERLALKRVYNPDQAKRWSELFEMGFGYRISQSTVESTMDEIQYYIAGYNGFELGTVVLFVHPAEIAGIHSMGVIPEFRRQGFARNILIEVLAKAKLTSAKMATLQASKAGEPLYKEIGFKENFKLYNYQLNKTN